MSGDDAAARYQRAKEIFFELMDAPAESWAEKARELCGGDEELEREVASLLANRDAETDHVAPRIDGASEGVPSELSEALAAGLAEELSAPAGVEAWVGLPEKRFEAGDLFADRYTMEARIGVGGMGEVWRAHDRMLDETVALKFIRSRARGGGARGKGWVERLLREAAIARRISHRNVCRVHDAGEVDGRLFLSMEFVAGSDLAQALRQRGRFTGESSRRLAVELVDALAAVHAMGLLHRDLKPANILLNEEGEARISDFGLAISTDVATEEDSGSGTRMYMAPEQLRGEAPTEAGDLYALGLVLYEVLTHRRAFRSADEILEAAEANQLPPRPSVLVREVDPLLEHIVLRCLDPDPSGRPSAKELQVALAHDDPLAAVLSLGDVPTAEVLTGSQSRAPLRPIQARWMLAAALAALAIVVGLRRFHGVHLMPERSPEAFAEDARETLRALLGTEPEPAPVELARYAHEVPIYERAGFRLADRASSDPTDHHFWYRAADAPLWPREGGSQLFGWGRVRAFDPVPGRPGETTALFDRTGALVFLDVRRLPSGDGTDTPPVAWARVFERAGLEWDAFESTEPLPARAAQADRHLAWQTSDGSTRVEAATRGNQVVAFEVLEPISTVDASGDAIELFTLLNTLLIAALFAAAMPRALRHFRSGRGDPRISLRVALFTTFVLAGSWFPYADYPENALERFVFCISGVFSSFAGGFLVWILAVAVEPSVQRNWPRTFITWSHFFRGHVDRPGVRSDLLTGLSLGLLVSVIEAGLGDLAKDASNVSPAVQAFRWSTWAGISFEAFSSSILLCLEFVVVLAALRWVLRRKPLAVAGTWVVACLLATGTVEGPGPVLLAILSMSLMLGSLVRYGFLATFALAVGLRWMENTPVSPVSDAWYAPYGNATLALVAVALVWAAWPLLWESSTRRSSL